MECAQDEPFLGEAENHLVIITAINAQESAAPLTMTNRARNGHPAAHAADRRG